ncbi:MULTISPECIES: LysM peptidoglycan-binding domain-containing protein [Streptomyces]|uniref:Peptigoglycan-binding protein LysM n=2 Tax=Streptomyces TaxID=1883 RepID=A0ABU4K1Q1_9ACTN|nr:peptigoglycan-binding protein LysM [Streptomyces roseolus]MDX2291658.1 peptigoglycan-binding protein LysM [Streptomyces roseolus]
MSTAVSLAALRALARGTPIVGLERATLTNAVTGAKVKVLFNPEEYTVHRETNFAQLAVPGLSAPVIQFVSGQARTLEMELFLDSLEANHAGAAGSDVREQVRKVVDLMDIDPTVHAPPPVVFTWGSLTFTSVISRVSQRFVMFLPNGVPVRARLTVTFTEFRNADLEAKEVKRQTADYTKIHVTVEGDTLPMIAWREYGSTVCWRPIALHNGIDDPRVLPVGLRLVVPRLPYADPATGEVHDVPAAEGS